MPPRAKIQVRSPEPRKEPPKDGRKQKRFLLPSERVVAFVVPNVGEFMELRNEVFIAAARKTGDRSPTEVELAFEMGPIALRTLLVGMTEQPVRSIFRGAFSVEAERAKIGAALREALTEKWAKDHDGEAPTKDWLDGEVADRVPAILNDAITKAQDVEAMKASAVLAEVNDITWGEQRGEVGKYLAAMPFADVGTVEAADWNALDRISRELMPVLGAADDVPKAQRPRIAPLR